MSKFAVILAAAGKSSRFGDRNFKKPFAPLENKAVWLHSAERFLKRDDVKQLIMVIDPEDREDFLARFGANVAILGIDLVDGGSERCESVNNGLAALREDIEYVAIHDAARPCLADEWIDSVFNEAKKSGAAILANRVVATLKRENEKQQIKETVDRTGLWEAQTPQVFRRDLLQKAYEKRGNFNATDEAQLVERLGEKVQLVSSSFINIKITTREDLKTAQFLMKALPKPKSILPSHPFEGDDLWR